MAGERDAVCHRKRGAGSVSGTHGGLPDAVIACVGGGSNAIGLFHPFLGDSEVEIFGIEAGGVGSDLGEHAATIVNGSPGVLHGCYTLLLQDPHGQVQETQSVSAGLDYAAVGPEHAFLSQIGRVEYRSASDDSPERTRCTL